MFNRFIKAIVNFAQAKSNQYAAPTAFLRGMLNGFLTTAHHAVMISGVAAITVLSIFYFKPDVTADLKAFSPFTPAMAEQTVSATPHMGNLMDVPAKPLALSAATSAAFPLNTERKSSMPSRQQQLLVSEWLSKRYHVAGDATYMLVSATYLTADEIKLDPLLILAVMAIESGFNPFAESPVGAQGLMQVMSKLHHEKFQELGGVKAALNPVANIKVGSLILKDYVTRGGSVEAGLKLYVGAADLENDAGYGAKVLAEYRRLKEVSLGRKVPVFTTSASKSVPKPDDIDSLNDKSKTLPPSEEKSLSSNQHLSPKDNRPLVAGL
ncbi:MAG: transglycosylase SLT domain-containing protein [Burkholderiaceae bacterium]